MNFAKLIATIIVALTAIASVSAAWSFRAVNYGPSSDLLNGNGYAAFSDQGWGTYGAGWHSGSGYVGYSAYSRNGALNSAGLGYGVVGYDVYGKQAQYAVTSVNVNNGAVRSNVYRQNNGGYGGYATVGSSGFMPYPYYAANTYYNPVYNPGYVGNSFYTR